MAIQEDAARRLVAGRTTETLLQIVRDIAKMVVPGDGRPAHAFPQLAGSHLSEVCQQLTLLSPRLALASLNWSHASGPSSINFAVQFISCCGSTC